MPRIAMLSVALLTIAGTLLAPLNPTWAQGAPATSAAAPGSSTPSSPPITVPARGLTMDQVEGRFGVPEAKLPAVGDPPITRWVYRDFTVYFEGRYAIHAVVHQP